MGLVHRTARVRLRVTRGQARRCYGLLRAGGDVWAALIDVNRERFRGGARPIANFQEWCREMTGAPLGELARVCAEGIAKRYCDAFIETARRRRRGERARYPRRKRALFPMRFRTGAFALDGRRVRLAVARGTPPLWVRLARDVPYPGEQVRSVTLLVEAGRLCLDVTAAVPVEAHELDRKRVAGVDIGIIHPFAVAADDEALVVSGRQLRAEERLHLADSKAIEHRVGTLAVGDPTGITCSDAGRRQNLRLRQWRRTHLMRALADKAETAGIQVKRIDERATSSTCPECTQRTPKPKGREFSCPHCGHTGHRDLVAARNIAGRSGGTTSSPLLVMHRRAGSPPARRDRRRHLMDQRRSRPAPGRPRPRGSRSQANRPEHPLADRFTSTRSTPDEDQPTRPNKAKVA
jgi:transposase